MNKAVAAIGVLILIVGGFFLFRHHSSAPTVDTGASSPVTSAPSETTNPAAATSTSSGSANATFTLADVAQHSGSASCYSAINGNVYDLTNWINQHPGGAERILSICGKDGSSAFNAQHGNPSDTRPKEILATFKIGTLAE